MSLTRSKRWQRWLAWCFIAAGGVVIAAFMIGFHHGEEWARVARERVLGLSPWWFLLITPLTLGLIRYLTLRFIPVAAGSGIPQVMALTEQPTSLEHARNKLLLSPAGTLFKVVAVCLSMAGGGSVGREGPAIQIGASLLAAWSQRLRKITIPPRMIVITGAAAGLAAAFGTPFAGVVYAFEEFLWRKRYRASAIVPITIVVAAVTAWLLTRDRQFFDVVTDLAVSPPWWSILTLAAFCGLSAGIMGWLMVIGLPRLLPRPRSPIHGGLIAAALGVVLALIGIWSGGLSMGSGNETTALLLDRNASIDSTVVSIGLTKALATMLTFSTGVPAGILTPSLAIGGGFGYDFALLANLTEARQLLALFGMTAFLAGVIRTPVTTALIVAEMSGFHAYGLELLVSALIGCYGAKAIMRESVYEVALHQILKPINK
ncbi:MAG: chloride channel protein [Steroidobacteraceae bacterium]